MTAKAIGLYKKKLRYYRSFFILGLVLFVVTAMSVVFIGNISHRTNYTNIRDKDRMNDLLKIEASTEAYIDRQNAFGEARIMPHSLQDLQLSSLKGSVGDYEYSEPKVWHYGYSYTICTNFKKEVGKFSENGYPGLSDEQVSALYTKLSAPYYAHRAGHNCFKRSVNDVKGSSTELVGPVGDYKL